MNGYVINVRGINASGKSTSVRQYCQEFDLKPKEIEFGGIRHRVMSNGKRVAIGWYRPYSVSEGCDAFKGGKDDFKMSLEYILTDIQPEVVLYEKQIWSTTYKLTKEISSICRRDGYQFIAINMLIHYETALNRLFKRNGGNMTNLQNFDNRFYQVQCARKNMRKHGLACFDVDVEKIPEEKMGEKITQTISLFEKGAA